MALLASGYVNLLQYANTHSIQFQIIMKQIISCSKLSYLLGLRIIHEITVMYLSMQVEEKIQIPLLYQENETTGVKYCAIQQKSSIFCMVPFSDLLNRLTQTIRN